MIYLDELEKLAKAATTDSWEFERLSWEDGSFSYERNTANTFIAMREESYIKSMDAKFDSDFIAAANPTAILELIARIRSLEARCEMMQDKLEFINRILPTHMADELRKAINRRYIAAANPTAANPTAILELIARIRSLEARCERLRGQLKLHRATIECFGDSCHDCNALFADDAAMKDFKPGAMPQKAGENESIS